MKAATEQSKSTVPKGRQKHHSYDDSVDEPAKLVENESVEIEGEVPAEENEPLERMDKNNDSDSPAFEE
jgi:hypothetical protein